MITAKKILGACIRSLREQRQMSLEILAAEAGLSYQYLSGVETGKKNFSIEVLESLAAALDISFPVLVAAAYSNNGGPRAPVAGVEHFRSGVPLPPGLSVKHLEAAFNETQSVIHRLNANLAQEIGAPLHALIQGNNFSGLVSNLLTNALDKHSPYKHNHHQRYPDLVRKRGAKVDAVGLEIKTTINTGKGGESHNGHGGWHLIACYEFLANGDVSFIHVMLGQLNGHQHAASDWSYVGSKVNVDTGSRRTETYATTLAGTTKLRDGTIYLNRDKVDFSRWREARDGAVPAWSIFAKS